MLLINYADKHLLFYHVFNVLNCMIRFMVSCFAKYNLSSFFAIEYYNDTTQEEVELEWYSFTPALVEHAATIVPTNQ